MQKYFNSVTNSRGDAILGARVAVSLANGSLATIYSDNGVTTQPNPITTDGNGYFAFYAADGRYDLRITAPGIRPIILNDILLEDIGNQLTDFEERVYPGVYESPPTTRPSGAACVEGDRCTIMVGEIGYEHLRSGGVWIIPNIDAANLAMPEGAAIGGFDNAETQSIFDNTLPVQSYAAMLAYTGRAKGIRITTKGLAGNFQYNAAGANTTDWGTRFAHASGVGFWERVGGGTPRIDWWLDGSSDDVALQRALDAQPGRLIISRRLVLNTAKNSGASIFFEAGGPGASLDFSGGNGGLNVSGTLTQISDLAAPVALRASSITLTDASQVADDDLLIIYNPANGSWFSARDSYRAGEFLHVHSVAGNVVKLYGCTDDAYAVADVDIYKVSPVNCFFDGVRLIESASTAAAPLKISLGRGLNLSAICGNSKKYSLVVLDRCYDTMIAGSSPVNNSPLSGTDYGITFSSCQKVTLIGGGPSASRHAIAIGSSGAVGGVPNRHFLISSTTVENGGDSGLGATDMHGNCQHVTYSNCIIRNHANMAGMDATYSNCTIYGRPPFSEGLADGSCVFGSEVAGGLFKLDNCTFISDGDWNAYGLIYLSPADNMRADLVVSVTNPTIISNSAPSTLGKILHLIGRGANKKISASVTGPRGAAPHVLCVIYANDTINSEFLSDYLIADDVGIVGSAAPYLIFPTPKIANVKTREMTQRGRVPMTSLAANSLVAARQPFPYRYSREPSVLIGVSNALAVTGGPTAGKNAIAKAFEIRASDVRPAIYSSDGANFTADVSLSLSWNVGVNDI